MRFWFSFAALLVASSLLSPLDVRAADSSVPAAPAKELAPSEKATRLKERDKFNSTADKLASSGKYEEAIDAIESMLAIERTVLGDESPDVEGSLAWLARLCSFAGRKDRARSAVDELVTLRTKKYAADSATLAEAKNVEALVKRLAELKPENLKLAREGLQAYDQAVALRNQDKLKEALPLLEQASQQLRKQIGDPFRVTSNAWLTLGFVQESLNDLKAAEKSLAAAAEMIRAALGETHPDLGMCENTWGRVLATQKEYAAGDEHLARAIAIRAAALGKGATDTQNSLISRLSYRDDWAAECELAADFDKARDLRNPSYELAKEYFGETHWRTINEKIRVERIAKLATLSPEDLKQLSLATQKLTEAGAAYDHNEDATAASLSREAWEIRRKLLGPDASDVATADNQLGIALLAIKDFTGAQAALSEAASIWQRCKGPDHVDTLTAQANWGELARQQQDYPSAVEHFRMAYLGRRRVLGEKSASTLATGKKLSEALVEVASASDNQADFPAAEKAWQECADVTAQLNGETHWQTVERKVALAHSRALAKLNKDQRLLLGKAQLNYEVAAKLRQDNKPQDAIAPAENALKTRRELLSLEDRDTIYSLLQLAEALNEAKQYDRAAAVMAETLPAVQKVYANNHGLSAYAQEVSSLVSQGKGDIRAAAAAYREAYVIRRNVFGAAHASTTDVGYAYTGQLKKVVDELEKIDDYPGAASAEKEIFEQYTLMLGDEHYLTRDAKFQLRTLQKTGSLTPQERQMLREADAKFSQGFDLREKGNHAEALQAFEAAAKIRGEILGEKHLYTAFALDQSALSLADLKKHADALKRIEAGLPVVRDEVGVEHPAYFVALNILAQVQQAAGNEVAAFDALLQVVDTRLRLFGKEHKETVAAFDRLLTSGNRLSSPLLAKSDVAAAKRIRSELNRVAEAMYGAKDPRTVSAQWVAYQVEIIAGLRQDQRQLLVEADKLLAAVQQKLAKAPRTQGGYRTDDPQLSQNDVQSMIQSAQTAVQWRKQVLGAAHLLVADALETLALATEQSQDYVKAKAYYEEGLAIRQKALGAKHPQTVAIRSRVGQLLPATLEIPFVPPDNFTPAQRQRLVERDRWDAQTRRQIEQKDWEGAIASAQAMLAIEREVLTDYHHETALTYEMLESLSGKMGDFESQRTYQKWLVAIYTKLYGPGNWKAREYQVSLDAFDTLVNLPPEKLQQIVQVENVMSKINVGFDEAQVAQALQVCRNAKSLLAETLGQGSVFYANCLYAEAKLLETGKHWDQAEPLFRQSLAITGSALGTHNPVYRQRVRALDGHYSEMVYQLTETKQYAAAEKLSNESIALLSTVYPQNHWRVLDAKAENKDHQAFYQFSAADQETIRTVNNSMLDSFSSLQDSSGTLDLEKCRQAAADFARIYGADSIAALKKRHSLGAALRIQRHFGEAANVLEQVLADRRKYCLDHPQTARACMDLGNTYFALGRYTEAEGLFTEGKEILQRINVAGTGIYITLLNNLALACSALHDDDRAEILLKEVIRDEFNPPDHSDPNFDGDDLGNLTNHQDDIMGEFNISIAMQDREVKGIDPALANQRDYSRLAKYVNNLAMRYLARGKAAEAESLFRQSLWLLSHSKYPLEEDLTICLANLMNAYEAQGKLDTAEILADRVVDMRSGLSELDPKKSLALSNRAAVAFYRQDFARAQEDWQAAYDLRLKAFGPEHCNTVLSLADLSLASFAAGKYADAERMLAKAMDQSVANLRLTMTGQSERQQLAMRSVLGGQLDYYLTLAHAAQMPAEKIYPHVLAWKGTVLAQQRRQHEIARLAFGKEGEAIAKLQQSLATTASDLAAMNFASSSENFDIRKQLEELSRKKDDLERQLAKAIQDRGGEKLTSEISLADIKHLLPPRTAVVDYIVYKSIKLPPDKQGKIATEPHLAAFVVRQNGVKLFNLGPTEPIDKLVDACREQWTRSKPRVGPDPGTPLRAALWEPLAGELSDADTVLVAPDGAVSRFPLAALPGKQPDKFLIEELAVATIPAPQMLGELLSVRGSSAKENSAARFLAVGNVDFGKAAPAGKSNSSLRGGGPANFAPLPGTAVEVDAIRKLYQSQFKETATMLQSASATKQALQQNLAQARWIHLATHGFFAPEIFVSANSEKVDPLNINVDVSNVEGWNPGLLSGIVLAGANQSTGLSPSSGILTAEEVANLDLGQTDLVVLSACETGLGRLAGGEGALGIQRAFHAAGVRTVLASLWKVDDNATQLLMTEFYRNLWEKKVSPLQALRAAQLALLNRTVDTSRLRGLSLDEPGPEAGAAAQPARLNPRLWAAFVLSGSP